METYAPQLRSVRGITNLLALSNFYLLLRTAMEATRLLKSQHEEVNTLFAKFEKASSAVEKEQIFTRIADNLAAHCTIEEKIFYPSVFVEDLEDKLEEAVEEHLAAKRVIADLLEMDPSDKQYSAKVKVLQEEIEHHVQEEEEELFPQVRKEFQAVELNAMGEAMSEMFDQLMLTSPRNSVPAETAHAAPLS